MSNSTHELTMRQVQVLAYLHRRGPARTSAIAEMLDCSTPTVTGIMDRLAWAGYITRNPNPNDRREVLHDITQNGEMAVLTLVASLNVLVGNVKVTTGVSP